MPRFDVVERHALLIRARSDVVYSALRRADFASGAVPRMLLSLRAVPAAILAVVRSPSGARDEWRERRARRGSTLANLERAGFRVVAEDAPHELVLGVMGRFWTPRGGICRDFDSAVLRAGPPAGYAVAAWNFTLEPQGAAQCVLRTETRVWCAPDVRRRFRLYWLLVRPGSGLIRRSMLRAIRREAEGSRAARVAM